MQLRTTSIIKIFGYVLLVMGLAMIPAFMVSTYYQEVFISDLFLFLAMIELIAGLLLCSVSRVNQLKLKVSDGFFILVLSWFLASVIASLPYYFTGVINNPVDAFFESCSGLTTTGATVLEDVEHLPKSILFWRSLTSWIGGVAILIFAIGLFPSLGLNGHDLLSPESNGPVLDKLSYRKNILVRQIYCIYISLTIVEILLLKLGGMGFFDATIHSMGTVSTGGFSNYNAGIGHFNNTYIRLVIIWFMIMCSSNYTLFFKYPRSGFVAFFQDAEYKLFTLILAFFSIIIFGFLLLNNFYSSKIDAAIDSVFQVSSIVSTTGYYTTNYAHWPVVCQMLLLCLMFVGGCAASPAGGVKVVRILVIVKLVLRGFQTRLHHHNIKDLKLNGARLQRDTIIGVTNFTFLYIFMTFIGTFIVAFDNIDIITTLSAVVSCLGNIGVGFSSIGPATSFSCFSGISKILLSIYMIAGRLELYALYVLLMPGFWRRNY